MKKRAVESIEVKYGGARALVKQRADGLWCVRWREAGKGRNTTSPKKERALELAKAKVRALAGSQGGQLLTADDAALVARLKAVAGQRSPFAVLEQMEDATRRLGGWEVLARALRFYEESGMATVERVSIRKARNRFLDAYEKKSTMTRAGLRKELDAFMVAHEGLSVCDIGTELLGAWILRKLEDGTAPSGRFANNRLDSWRTFLNRCRAWNYWPKGEKHPAELIERQRVAQRLPPIWTVDQVKRAVEVLPERYLPCLVIGCFAGLRPFELTRVTWDLFDWDRRYLHVTSEVALKTLQERFVPLEANVIALLQPIAKQHEPNAKCCFVHDRHDISVILRREKVIKAWPQDVMRHSYISYRIARGDGAGLVAEHSGNSERIIRKHYRRPLRTEDGAAWFAVGAD